MRGGVDKIIHTIHDLLDLGPSASQSSDGGASAAIHRHVNIFVKYYIKMRDYCKRFKGRKHFHMLVLSIQIPNLCKKKSQ